MSGIDHAQVPSYHFYINRDRLIHFLDPDASTCEALSVLFRLEGFQTAFSTDTASFFAGLQRRAPDVAAINLTLGAEDGVDVLRRVKAMHAGTVVFMLCNGTEVELAVQAMKAGAYGVVVKPIAQEPFLHEVACDDWKEFDKARGQHLGEPLGRRESPVAYYLMQEEWTASPPPALRARQTEFQATPTGDSHP